jgi:hypothetical protein
MPHDEGRAGRNSTELQVVEQRLGSISAPLHRSPADTVTGGKVPYRGNSRARGAHRVASHRLLKGSSCFLRV